MSLDGSLRPMRTSELPRPSPGVHIRPGRLADLDPLWELENRVFATDRMSRRSLRHVLASSSAAVLVAETDDAVAGVAVVLFRANSRIARFYSLAVAPQHAGRGIGSALTAAVESAARSRSCERLRAEMNEKNDAAIGNIRKAGYRQFGRRQDYYQDGGHALRFEKQLTP